MGGSPQLPDRHRELLELYAHRRRYAHAGAAAFLHARLHAVHAGVACSCCTRRRGFSPISAAAGSPRASASRACWRPASCCRSAGSLMLSGLDPGWGATLSVAWVVMAQGISGVAKDVTKTASKSAIKATSEGGNGQLFNWVAWFTGSKNAMKGVRLLRRRAAARNWSASARRCG